MNKVLIFALVLIGVLAQPSVSCTFLSCLATGANKQGQSTRQSNVCINGYFWATQSCQPCKPIDGGYYQCSTYWGTGSLTCLSGWSQVNGLCLDLPDGCATYSLNSASNAYVCGTCMAGYTLMAGVCVSNQNCKTFSSTRYLCTECNAGYYLNWNFIPSGNKSLQTTDTYYTSFDSFCTKCSIQNCSDCPSANTCRTCSAGYYWSYASSSTTTQGTCTACLTNCINCSSATTCTNCIAGYYVNTSNNTVSCAACFTNCAICSSASQCTTCNTGYFLTSTTSCDVLPTGCLGLDSSKNCTQCATGFVLNSSSPKTCTACGTGCQSCTITSTNVVTCTTCMDLYYGIKDSSSVVSCGLCSSVSSGTGWLRCNGPVENSSLSAVQVTQCVDGFYVVGITSNGTTTQTCVAAVRQSGCLTLASTSNSTTNVCASCVTGYGSYQNGQCLSCPPQSGSKVQLSAQCTTCGGSASTEISCTGCTPGYFLQQANSASQATCAICSTGCIECSSASTCTKCGTGYYSSGTTANQTCSACVTNCASCTDGNSCAACKDGFFSYSGSSTAQSSCVACQFGCATCTSPGNVCQTCVTGYVLQSGGCVPLTQANCAKSLADATINKPITSTGCAICEYGFHLVQNKCVQSVWPYGGYAYGQTTNVTTDAIGRTTPTVNYAPLIAAVLTLMLAY